MSQKVKGVFNKDFNNLLARIFYSRSVERCLNVQCIIACMSISLGMNRVSISYYHDIYQSFDNGFEVWGVLLDMSKKMG